MTAQEERRIRRAFGIARDRLLAARRAEGFWLGRLSSSALAAATAVSALVMVRGQRSRRRVAMGVDWLRADQNDDGGWGDSPASASNVPTTMLVDAAFRLAATIQIEPPASCRDMVRVYLDQRAGRTGAERVAAVRRLYGEDRTFAVPILANCALAPSGGGAQIDWREVPGLPFELARVPRGLFRRLRLRVVSYALPALIAIGRAVHAQHPTRNPLLRLLRNRARGPTLRLLERIQPEGGGFLEAVPLTGFVAMSLAVTAEAGHAVADRAARFIEVSQRPDGGWPIDSNLSIWLTNLAVSALAHGEVGGLETTRFWLLARQYREAHTGTGASPGGWGWTHLPGGVPDCDDTAGALLALHALGEPASEAIRAGMRWLLDMQNADGGWPTFCRGWGKLPFDRSAPDLTAHALRALHTWRRAAGARETGRAIARGLRYLKRTQRPDGAWAPLWFGNQHAPGQQNPVYGTSRVLLACCELGRATDPEAARGRDFLLYAQNADGAWGGDRGVAGSVEETALAIEALAAWPEEERSRAACRRGALALAEMVENGGLDRPAPIGLYFARLWYAERLYPVIWTVGALGRVLGNQGVGHSAAPCTRAS